MSLPQPEDFSTPFTADDAVIECGCTDPAYGEPADWPEWTDDARSAHGTAITPDESWNPSDQDWQDWAEHKRECDDRRLNDPWYLAWCDQQAAEAEWQDRMADMHEDSVWRDRLAEMNHQDGDDNARNCGLPVG